MIKINDPIKTFDKIQEIFGVEFLDKIKQKAACHPLTKPYNEFINALNIFLRNKMFEPSIQAFEIILLVNYFSIYSSLKLLDANFKVIESEKIVSQAKKEIIKELKKTSEYNNYFSQILIPVFLLGENLKISLINEDNHKKPDYLIEYDNNKLLAECKCGDYMHCDRKTLKRRIEKHISKAKKQLQEYPELPGILFIHINNLVLFKDSQQLMQAIEKKINLDDTNLACVCFVNYEIKNGQGAVLHFVPFLNFRSNKLLPKKFNADILKNKGYILLAAKKGEKFITEQPDGTLNKEITRGICDIKKEEKLSQKGQSMVTIKDVRYYYGL